MLHFIRLLLVLGLVLPGASCKKDLDPDLVDFDILAELQLSFREALKPGTRPLQLLVSTSEPKSCLNYSLLTDFTWRESKAWFDINDLELKGTCTPGSAYVRDTITSEGFNNPKTYPIAIGLKKQIVSTGQLVVTDEAYYLELKDSLGFRFPLRVLRRIPENLVWVSLQYRDAGQEADVKQLLLDLALKYKRFDLAEGNYGYFTMLNDQLLSPSTQPSLVFQKGLPLELPTDRNEFAQMISQLRANMASYGNTMALNVTAFDGSQW